MKYFITEYKNQEAKDTLKNLGLYCYSLRSADNNWGKIETIENHVLVNRYGSIITNEEITLGDKYPDDFIDFDDFSLKNTKVNSIDDLKDNISDCGIIDLSTEENINYEFTELFGSCENFEDLDEKTIEEKYALFIEHYDNVNDYELIDNGNRVYQLLHISLENQKSNDMELI